MRDMEFQIGNSCSSGPVQLASACQGVRVLSATGTPASALSMGGNSPNVT
jgi:hypothetical protein